MYGEVIYGQRLYGAAVTSEAADSSESTDGEGGLFSLEATDCPVCHKTPYIDIARYAPEFLRVVRELAEIWHTEGHEAGLMAYGLSDLFAQCFIDTATWGLERWEEMYGVVTNTSLSYEQRREILIAKRRGRGTTTAKMIEEMAAAFSGGEIKVIEDNPNSLFIVRFIGIKGIPQNMQAFISILEEIKPAHLAYQFEYRYTVWNELLPYTWDDLSGMNWEDTRTLKEA